MLGSTVTCQQGKQQWAKHKTLRFCGAVLSLMTLKVLFPMLTDGGLSVRKSRITVTEGSVHAQYAQLRDVVKARSFPWVTIAQSLPNISSSQ